MSARRPAFFGSYGEPFRNSTRWPFASIAKALLLAFAPGTSCSAAANVLKSSSEYLRRLLKIIIFVVNAPFFWFPCCLRGNMKVKGGVILKKDPELYEVFDYFRKVLIDELDNADIETTEGQTIKTAVVTAAEKVCSQLKPIE